MQLASGESASAVAGTASMRGQWPWRGADSHRPVAVPPEMAGATPWGHTDLEARTTAPLRRPGVTPEDPDWPRRDRTDSCRNRTITRRIRHSGNALATWFHSLLSSHAMPNRLNLDGYLGKSAGNDQHHR